MKKFIITEEEKNKILGMHKSATSKHYLMEQTTCDKTFDDLKNKVLETDNWTLEKKDGSWTLSTDGFCTKDIVLYGVKTSLSSSSIPATYSSVDETKNRIYFNDFNVGPSNTQEDNTDQQTSVECPVVMDYNFFSSIFNEFPNAKYKQIEWDEKRNIKKLTLSSDGRDVLKSYVCSSPSKLDTTDDLNTLIPGVRWGDAMTINSVSPEKELIINGGFYVNKGQPFKIKLN
jgi:hypothetical protein